MTSWSASTDAPPIAMTLASRQNRSTPVSTTVPTPPNSWMASRPTYSETSAPLTLSSRSVASQSSPRSRSA